MVFFGSSFCLSLLFGSLTCIYFLIFFLFPFLLFSCGFRFIFSLVGPCLVFFIACALVLSIGGVVFHKCLSAFCPPLFSVPLVISPLAFLPFLRSSCGCLFLSLFLRCLQLLHLFLRWLRPPPLASLLLSLGVPGTSVLPSSGVSIGWGGGVVSVEFCTGIASGSYRCFFSLHCLATSVCASSCGSFFLSSCFPASGCLKVLSPDSSLLPSSSLTWPVSSAPGWGSPSLVFSGSLLPAVLCLAFRYCLLPLFALLLLAPLRVSMALPLRCLGLLGLLVYIQFCSQALQGFQRPLFLLLFALLLLPPLLVSLALPLRCPGLLWLLVSLRFAPGFSAASSLTPFCAAPVASTAGLFAFPQLRLTPSLISLALLLGLALLRLRLRCLGLLRLLPFSSLCLVRVLLSHWSGFVAQVATGAVAPVPGAFVSHLCLPPLMLMSAFMVAILALAAGSSLAPLPTCCFSWSSSWSFCS